MLTLRDKKETKGNFNRWILLSVSRLKILLAVTFRLEKLYQEYYKKSSELLTKLTIMIKYDICFKED